MVRCTSLARRLSRSFQTTLITFSILIASAHAQSGLSVPSGSTAVVQRDASAIAATRLALTRMGGEAVFGSIKDTQVEADCTRVSTKRTDTHHVRWISAGEYFRVDGGSGDTRGAFNGPRGRFININGKPMALEERGARAMKQIHLPSLLLRAALANPSMQFEALGQEDLPSGPATHVRITDMKASANSFEPVAEDWYFNTKTALPIKLNYLVQGLNSVRRFASTTVEYGEFKTDASTGVVIPTSFSRSFEGGPTTTCVIASFSANASPDAQIFTNQAGGQQ